MKTFNCLVLEDTLGDQLAIEMVLEYFPEISATYVHTPQEFLEEFSKTRYQIFIIDIILNDTLTGIDLIHSISDSSAWVIISSSMDSRDYYEEFKDLKFNKFYIKKPVDEFVFRTNIESFIFQQNIQNSIEEDEPFLSLKQGNYVYKVLYSEITLIETSDHATTVHTITKKYITYTALKTLEESLKNNNFARVNRNSLVNMKIIERINFKENYLEVDKHKVLISRSNRQKLIEKYQGKSDSPFDS